MSKNGVIVQIELDAIIHVVKLLQTSYAKDIEKVSELLCTALGNGKKILICGNGGSAAEAQHFAAELVGRFREQKRRTLPAIALTTDSSILTAIANDFGYDHVFSRQINALGEEGDIVFVMSTSGMSPSVVEAMHMSRRKKCVMVALTGIHHGELYAIGDELIIGCPSRNTARIQEMHLIVIHVLCAIIDEHFTDEVTGGST